MEGKASYRVVAITILNVATYGMAKILHVHTNLILSSRFKLELYERMATIGAKHTLVGESIFPAIVCG